MRSLANHRIYELLRGAKANLDAAVGTLRSRTSREARRQLALKDGEIAALRRELSRVRPDRVGVATGTPVFFVVGNQKSGTTWLMRMLDAHPEILCKGEGRFFGAAWRQKSLKARDPKRPPSSLYNAVLDAEYLRLWIERSVWSRDDDSGEHLANLMRMAVDYFLEGELIKSGKRVVGDKSPLLTPDTIREIARIYPEARVIHIIRDGRDVAVSAAYHSLNFGNAARRNAFRSDSQEKRKTGESIFAPGQLEKLAADWKIMVSRAVQDGPSVLDENYAEVGYERLLEEPQTEIRQLLQFLGVEASAEAVRLCVGSASFEKLSKGRERGEEDPSSFFRKGVAGDWRRVFTERDRRVFKGAAGDLLLSLGYEKGEDW